MNKKIMTKDYYTLKEFAKSRNVSTKTISRRIKDGMHPEAEKIGKEWRFPFESNKVAETHRKYKDERKILNGASSTISIMGINSLRILHQNREMLINKVNEGVNVRILLLDIDSKYFHQRATLEESYNGKVSGRLRAESLASFAICKDINNFLRSPSQKFVKELSEPKFSLGYYSSEPNRAMIITDHEKPDGFCSVNFYPYYDKKKTEDNKEKPIENVRGLCGEYLKLPKYSDKIAFDRFVKEYNVLWKISKKADLSQDINFSTLKIPFKN